MICVWQVGGFCTRAIQDFQHLILKTMAMLGESMLCANQEEQNQIL